MMANPNPKTPDDRICQECEKPINKHTDEEKWHCNRKMNNRKFGSRPAGVI